MCYGCYPTPATAISHHVYVYTYMRLYANIRTYIYLELIVFPLCPPTTSDHVNLLVEGTVLDEEEVCALVRLGSGVMDTVDVLTLLPVLALMSGTMVLALRLAPLIVLAIALLGLAPDT